MDDEEKIDDDTFELKMFLLAQITHQKQIILDCYNIPNNGMYMYVVREKEIYDTVTGIANSDILDFDRTKDMIA